MSELEDVKSALRGHLAEADQMLGFQNSEVGQRFFALLKQRYSDMVVAAVKENDKYRLATQTIESLFTLVGDTLNVGKEAERELDRLAAGEAEEGY